MVYSGTIIAFTDICMFCSLNQLREFRALEMARRDWKEAADWSAVTLTVTSPDGGRSSCSLRCGSLPPLFKEEES